ncbi:MAG: hypothetical protein KDD61_02270 [Bdellovibrionales bacterium]|nr:hypothetical protein [Bdellovibrionales bacterium]
MIRQRNNFLLFHFAVRVRLFLVSADSNFEFHKIELFKVHLPNEGETRVILLSVLKLRERVTTVLSGSGRSWDEAFRKVCSELAEIIRFKELLVDWRESRSGWAAAFDEEQAAQNSYKELVERDALLMHILIPMLKSYPKTPFVYKKGKNIQLVKLQSVDPGICVILAGINYGEGLPWILGFGSDWNEDKAVDKAVLECILFDESKEAFKMSEYEERLSCLKNHLNQSSGGIVRDNLNSIFSGDGDLMVNLQFNRDQFKRDDVAKVGSRWTVKGSHPYLLSLKFCELWNEEKEDKIRLIESRGFEVQKWILHPFL